MARHPNAPRVRRQQAEADDALVVKALEVTAWAKQHATRLVVSGIVLILAITAGLYYLNYQRTLRTQAALELTSVHQTITAGNVALAIQDLETFLHQYGSTPSADEARVMLGQLYLEEDRPGDAANVVEPIAKRPGRPLGAQAAFLLAAAQEKTEELEAAERTYLRIGEEASFPFERRLGLDHAARIRLQRGDARGAAELYQQLIDLTPVEDPYHALYQLRLSEAATRAVQAARTSS